MSTVSQVRVDPEVFQRLQEVLADFFEQAEQQLQAAAGEIDRRREELAEERRAAVAALDELDATGRHDGLDDARARLDQVEGAVQRFDAVVAEYKDEAQAFRATLDERAGALLGRLREHVEAYLALQPAPGSSGGAAGRERSVPEPGADLPRSVPRLVSATVEVDIGARNRDREDQADE